MIKFSEFPCHRVENLHRGKVKVNRTTPEGFTTYILGTGTCHWEGYRFSRYWYKERYEFSQFRYKERYRISRFWRGVYHSKNPRTPCQKSEKIRKNLSKNPQIHTYIRESKNPITGTCTPKTKVPQKPQGQLKGNIYRRSTYNIKLLLINDA